MTKDELRAMRAELKEKQEIARAMRAAVKVAREDYELFALQVGEKKTIAAIDRAETREQRARERLSAYQARREKLRAAEEKIERLAALKVAMNASRAGAHHVRSQAGRQLAQEQIVRTHGVSDEKPRWEPRPEKSYL